jgi:two-component system sensor histidine kinase ChiS
VFVIFDIIEARRSMIEDISLVSNILGEETATAIIYNQSELVTESLASLKGKESILMACIYTPDGQLFSSYIHDNANDNCPIYNPAINTGHLFDQNYLFIYNNIITNDIIRGGIYIKSDLRKIKTKIRQSLLNALILSFIVVIISYIISKFLQQIISPSILHLAEVANKVKSGEYAVRAKKFGNDEIGDLTDAFNNMLDEIQEARTDLEEKVQERTADLEKALQAKSIFLSNMSHEIRTPIHGIINYSDFLVKDWEKLSDTERYYFSNKLNSNSGRLLSLINNLLDLSKLNAGKMEFSLEKGNLVEIINNIIQESEPLYKGIKDIVIDFKQANSKNYVTHFDADRISQVVRNLLSNSIKFTESGKIEIKLKHSTYKDKDENEIQGIKFIIQDNGIGIPEGELEDIFDKFNQSSRTKTGAGGTGLGLAICKEIIEAHQGKIWASNNASHGAKFTFILPQV